MTAILATRSGRSVHGSKISFSSRIRKHKPNLPCPPPNRTNAEQSRVNGFKHRQNRAKHWCVPKSNRQQAYQMKELPFNTPKKLSSGPHLPPTKHLPSLIFRSQPTVPPPLRL